jgi:hypothetical protein
MRRRLVGGNRVPLGEKWSSKFLCASPSTSDARESEQESLLLATVDEIPGDGWAKSDDAGYCSPALERLFLSQK